MYKSSQRPGEHANTSIASPAALCLAALKPKLPAQTIAALSEHVEPADTIIDGDFQPKICYHPRQGEGSRPHLRIPGRRISEVSDSQVAASPHLRGLRFPGRRIFEVSGGEDGARNCGNSQVKGEQKTEQKMIMISLKDLPTKQFFQSTFSNPYNLSRKMNKSLNTLPVTDFLNPSSTAAAAAPNIHLPSMLNNNNVFCTTVSLPAFPEPPAKNPNTQIEETGMDFFPTEPSGSGLLEEVLNGFFPKPNPSNPDPSPAVGSFAGKTTVNNQFGVFQSGVGVQGQFGDSITGFEDSSLPFQNDFSANFQISPEIMLGDMLHQFPDPLNVFTAN
nr:ethylene-responsive transcription factor ESR2-like [Ipomoea batatas]